MKQLDLLRSATSPRRCEILRLVWDQERTAGQVHRMLGDVSFAAVSQHLRALDQLGFVRCRREGKYRLYTARQEELESVRDLLESMWRSALYRLKIKAELEQARRGPKSKKRRIVG